MVEKSTFPGSYLDQWTLIERRHNIGHGIAVLGEDHDTGVLPQRRKMSGYNVEQLAYLWVADCLHVWIRRISKKSLKCSPE